MKHTCTVETDLDELIGHDISGDHGLSFAYGPIVEAMRRDEELVLENSRLLSVSMQAKIRAVIRGLFIPETEEMLLPGAGFSLTLR